MWPNIGTDIRICIAVGFTIYKLCYLLGKSLKVSEYISSLKKINTHTDVVRAKKGI